MRQKKDRKIKWGLWNYLTSVTDASGRMEQLTYDAEISRTETDLVAMMKMTGKNKDYELIEYIFNAENDNPNINSQYLRARYYDTVKGSFLTKDSYLGDIRNPLTLNRYSYWYREFVVLQ